MEAVFTSTAVVALAEIGDKTQLLAIVLATRFNRPVPIIFGTSGVSTPGSQTVMQGKSSHIMQGC